MTDAADHDGVVDVFVYGTLMPGHLRWHIIEPHVTERWQDTVAGTLFDTGLGYPGAVFDEAGRIPGWGLRLARSTRDDALRLLDETEGPHLYRRRLVATGVGRPAWAYEMLRDSSGLERIEGWSSARDEA